jgi:hypothetical protein
MPTGVVCRIKLDPFYQAFLRSRFEQKDIDVFSFPKGHDLSLLFQFLLKPKPSDPELIEPAEWVFGIDVPYMEHKNPFTYNYISKTRTIILASRIMRYWKMVSHDIISESRRKGMEKKEVIYFLLEELELSDDYMDRIEREYSRYLLEERQRKFLCKKKLLKNVKKLSDKRMKMA